jgi:hypothetical protein
MRFCDEHSRARSHSIDPGHQGLSVSTITFVFLAERRK